jgi:hypothetical protein
MNTELVVLNLSHHKYHLLAPDPRLVGASRTITSPDQVPTGASQNSLILYVVGHGVQHGLVDGDLKILDEAAFAAKIQSLRGDQPTLIVWDVCFAESMLTLGKDGTWPSTFVHIFSCRSFERTWHDDSTKPAVTLFSTELRNAIAALRAQGSFNWARLEERLQLQLQSLQKPQITPHDAYSQPSDFQIAALLASAS